MSTKVKACEISFNSMTGLSMRNITFQDLERKTFVVGRERSIRRYMSTDKILLVKGHLDVKALDDARYSNEDGGKTRMFPPCKRDLEKDLKVLDSITAEKLIDNESIRESILEALEKAKEF